MICVRELLEAPSLGLTGLAGMAGDVRLITWAHAVDLPDPWRWIAPGNLVMTTGAGLPQDAQAQALWLERLAQSHASALVVACAPGAPALSRALLEAAERLRFPVLAASFELEFVKLSRHVIGSVLQTQRERFKASERLFQAYAEALRAQPDPPGRLAALAAHLRLDLEIEDAGSGAVLVAGPQPAGHASAAPPALVERVPLGGRTRACLVIRRRQAATAPEDPLLVRTLVGLLGVELERLMIHRDAQREEGAALLRSLSEDGTDFALVRPLLQRRGLEATLVSLAISPGTSGASGAQGAPGAWSVDDIHQAPGLHQCTPLLLPDGELLLALAADGEDRFEALATHLGPGTVLGISGPITAATGFRESQRQARLALAQARESGARMLRYGDAQADPVLAPHSLADARALVARYLGPLIEHDRLQDACLLTTLARFLDNDGNWKATAFDLGIHRQTLVYRLKLIAQLTGLKPTTTNGTARLWLALQAGRTARLL